MATIDISRDHTLPLEDARKKAEDFANSMKERFEFAWKWSGDTIVFSAPSGVAKGTKGEVIVSEKSVRVTVDLPFMLRVMKGKIQSRIEEKLTELL